MSKSIVYSAVIPVYNESSNITALYERVSAVLQRTSLPYEIIFVDDGSSDSSYELLKGIALSDSAVCVLSFIKNFGQHKAVIAGFLEAEGKYVITMDADLQNPPEEIPKLISKISQGYDMVAGIRKNRKDPFFRRLGSLCINQLIFAITGLKMRDYGSMLRIFKNETAKGLADAFSRTEGYITMLTAKVTRNVAEVEVEHDQRLSGKSRYGLKALFRLLVKIIFCYHEGTFRLCGGRVNNPLFVVGRRIKHGREVTITAGC